MPRDLVKVIVDHVVETDTLGHLNTIEKGIAFVTGLLIALSLQAEHPEIADWLLEDLSSVQEGHGVDHDWLIKLYGERR